MHYNALRDPHTLLDAKALVRLYVSNCTFCGIYTGPTCAREIVHLRFTPQMHRDALCDPRIPMMQKHKFGVTCPGALFVESAQVPPEHEK
jgi:hypothetical protein